MMIDMIANLVIRILFVFSIAFLFALAVIGICKAASHMYDKYKEKSKSRYAELLQYRAKIMRK